MNKNIKNGLINNLQLKCKKKVLIMLAHDLNT